MDNEKIKWNIIDGGTYPPENEKVLIKVKYIGFFGFDEDGFSKSIKTDIISGVYCDGEWRVEQNEYGLSKIESWAEYKSDINI